MPQKSTYIEQSISDPDPNFSLDFDLNSYGYVVSTGPGQEKIDLFGAQMKFDNCMELRVVKRNANDVAGLIQGHA